MWQCSCHYFMISNTTKSALKNSSYTYRTKAKTSYYLYKNNLNNRKKYYIILQQRKWQIRYEYIKRHSLESYNKRYTEFMLPYNNGMNEYRRINNTYNMTPVWTCNFLLNMLIWTNCIRYFFLHKGLFITMLYFLLIYL